MSDGFAPSSGSRRSVVARHNVWRAGISPRLADVLDQVLRFSNLLHVRQPDLRSLLNRAFAENPDRASTAITRLAKDGDPALVAIAWAFFWIRQGELSQARNELEALANSPHANSFWGGMALLALGEVRLELGETEHGLSLIRRARQILEDPP